MQPISTHTNASLLIIGHFPKPSHTHIIRSEIRVVLATTLVNQFQHISELLYSAWDTMCVNMVLSSVESLKGGPVNLDIRMITTMTPHQVYPGSYWQHLKAKLTH